MVRVILQTGVDINASATGVIGVTGNGVTPLSIASQNGIFVNFCLSIFAMTHLCFIKLGL